MICFPNAKINLGLHIIRRREDGYHDLNTVFYPIPLRDALESIEAEDMSLQVHGIEVPGNPSSNLVWKAWEMLHADYPQLPQQQIHLLKNIPNGAGLGGGSSDAAFMLRLMNETYQLNLSAEQLQNYALRLGSDCPFFLHNTACIGEGRGEHLDPISLSLAGFYLVLVKPEWHVSTAWAFANLTLAPNACPPSKAVLKPIEQWREWVQNDFETPIFKAFPQMAAIKARFYEAGAIYSAMSGTGSVIYGIFKQAPESQMITQDAILGAHNHWIVTL